MMNGRRWSPNTYPRKAGDAWVWDQAHPEKRNGWLDFRLQRGVSVAQGAGVGGGSLIYANVLIEASRELFDRGWPAEITWSDLAPFYERVEQMLQPRCVPQNQVPERLNVLRQAACASGFETRFRPLPVAITFDDEWRYSRERPFDAVHSRKWINEHGKEQGTCVHCGNCYIGCPVGARNTLDLNYLARAEAHGAEVRPLHVVRSIAPEGNAYRIEFDRIENGRLVRGSVIAARVIVAAGSLGSTELLLRCRNQFKTLPNISGALGHRWSANGDFLTVSLQPAVVNPTHGPSITAAVDFLDGSVGGNRFFVEDGGFPDFLRAVMEREVAFDARNLTFSTMVFTLALVLRPAGTIPQSDALVRPGDGCGGRATVSRAPVPGAVEAEAETQVVLHGIARHHRGNDCDARRVRDGDGRKTAVAGVVETPEDAGDPPPAWRLQHGRYRRHGRRGSPGTGIRLSQSLRCRWLGDPARHRTESFENHRCCCRANGGADDRLTHCVPGDTPCRLTNPTES